MKPDTPATPEEAMVELDMIRRLAGSRGDECRLGHTPVEVHPVELAEDGVLEVQCARRKAVPVKPNVADGNELICLRRRRDRQDVDGPNRLEVGGQRPVALERDVLRECE